VSKVEWKQRTCEEDGKKKTELLKKIKKKEKERRKEKVQ
jgi:hypothetical protein